MSTCVAIDEYPIEVTKGRTIRVPPPEELPATEYVTRPEIVELALAAWRQVDGSVPLSFRLCGPPGVGKTAIVYQLARALRKDLYTMKGDKLDVDDLACTPVFNAAGVPEYTASPLFAAMLRGGLFFFDELDKAPAAALNPLASVLDDRRTLRSVLMAIQIKAHPDFRFCAAMNGDEEGNGLPDFLETRLRPVIHVGNPPVAMLRRILRAHFPTTDPRWIETYMAEFWEEEVTPREAKAHLHLARALAEGAGGPRTTEDEIRAYLKRAATTAQTQEAVEPQAEADEQEAVGATPLDREIPHAGEPYLVRRGRGKETTH